ncbi:hypothetical protein [Geomonas azotofigens]|uniref:hypothetical protein n=1 Tax=Geomonas azotofigens TaxID=2843196 RepID=UPI001C11D6E9|nr:hypothetical protein [Geomonas azotofigens]MBU5612872.1 hypothetical protein [Geomonas azotofigens]
MIGDNDTDKKGFSGLSGLASDFGATKPIKPEPEEEAKPSTSKQQRQPPLDTALPEPERKNAGSPPPIETVSSRKNDGGSGGRWIVGFIAVVLVIWQINSGDHSNKNPSYSPPSSSQSNGYPQSTTTPEVQPSSTVPSDGLQCTKPSIGNDNVLSVPEIRWCIREDIRIKAMRDVIDTNAGIDEFNRIVNDYNSRCGSYRYRQGALSGAERDVEAYRNEIVSEAILEARQLSSRSYPSVSPGVSVNSTPVRGSSPSVATTVAPENLTLEEQSKYNTAQRLRRLGYDVDWRTSSLVDMIDSESRISAANRLARLGYNVDWRTKSLTDMIDAESRIGTANRLSQLGYNVDWRTISLTDMIDAESRISAANRLKRKGVSVDWRNYSLTRLLDMEYGQN